MINSLFKLDRILNHQLELHFNVPYDDNEARMWEAYSKVDKANDEVKEWKEKYEDLQNKFKSFFDIPNQNELNSKFPWCGYIDINGKKYTCKHCEHESIIREIVLGEYLKEYLSVPASFYDHKPQGTFQEEYFAMKYLGFAKVSAFRDNPTKPILFFYDKLTWKQSREIYPT